jgi:hypothetical protein
MQTIDVDTLRRLSAVRPDGAKVLSLYINLDPTEFATPPARASAITSLMNDAQHQVEEIDGDLSHDDRMALREDVDAVREALASRGVNVGDVQQLGPEGSPGSRFLFFEDPDGNSWAVQELKRS